jgi:putative ABC transport system permease protein
MIGTLTMRGVRAHKARFILTTLSVLFGVAFVSGAFILRDSLTNTFDRLFQEVNEGIDVEVRAELAFGNEGTAQRDAIPAATLETVRGVDGVAIAEGWIQRTATLLDKGGKAITTQGAPTYGLTWSEADGDGIDRGITVAEGGRAPAGPDEVVIDKATADRKDFAVGDSIDIVTVTGRHTFTIVGLGLQGGEESFGGATIAGFDPDTAREVLGAGDTLDAVNAVAVDGVSPGELADRINAALPDGIEAVTGEQAAGEDADAVNQFVGIFGNVLLGFALVTLFVSAFIINNTFAIIVGQRIRELALLRAVGASPKQVRRIVVGESVIIAAAATTIGLLGGIGVAKGLIAAFNAAGAGFPETSTVFGVRTVAVAVLVGFGVTMVSALLPARRASRVPPVAAMQPELGFAALRSTRRLTIGLAVTAVGVVLLAIGLFGSPGGVPAVLVTAGLGAVMLFVGVANLSATFARPAAMLIGAPIARLFKVPGRLAQENAARTPRRTAATASALMIGIALVSTAAVLASSIKSSFANTLERAVTADYFITDRSFQGMPTSFTERLKTLPELSQVSAVRFAQFQIDGSTKGVSAADPATVGALFDLDVQTGSLDDLALGDLMLHTDPAKDLGVGIGDTVDVTWSNGTTETLRVVGTYDDATFAGNYVVSIDTLESVFTGEQRDFFVGARIADGVDPAAARDAVEAVAADFPQVKVEDTGEFRRSQEAQLNQSLVVINGMLGVAIVIALIGIANTLALSVFERTREIGLMRAVGAQRRQLKRMIRWEAVIVALFGGLLGMVIGTPLGIAVTNALPESFVNTLTIPYATLIGLVVLSAIAGLVAALAPARRAAKMNVLTAIQTE